MPSLRGAFMAVAALCGAAWCSGEVRYRVIDIGVLPGYGSSFGHRVSDGGQVCGLSSGPGTRAFLWTMAEGMVDLGPMANSQPGAVNSSGLVVGGYGDGNTEGWQYSQATGT